MANRRDGFVGYSKAADAYWDRVEAAYEAESDAYYKEVDVYLKSLEPSREQNDH